jgi:hypothetical protein
VLPKKFNRRKQTLRPMPIPSRGSRKSQGMGANVQLSNHPNFDEALEKIAKLKARTSWQPHPFGMGALAEARIFTVRVRARQSREAQVSR